VAYAIFLPSALVGLALGVQPDYVHDDNKHAHESLSADSEALPMSSSPNISFVLHDVARLFRTRLIKSNLLEACTQPAVDREKVHV
jgi:hypothetical protein